MRLLPSDPDIQTIVRRISEGVIDLQPDFQRGEVWSLGKKKRLIDSILRNWHVPPIHVVTTKGTQEVLDGQQRLVAIRDFVENKFSIDGNIEPINEDIKQLHGLRYRRLPTDIRNQFNQFAIRVYQLVDYQPEEPGELFYRLNQLTNLTSAEQRNAFFGPVRDQIKELVKYAERWDDVEDLIGFTNARMSYDDVIARVLCSLEYGSLVRKVTAGGLSDRFRASEPFSEQLVNQIKAAIDLLLTSLDSQENRVRFNKATLFSWLFFCTQLTQASSQGNLSEALKMFVREFHAARSNALLTRLFGSSNADGDERLHDLITIYNDRATSRVADVSSVIFRDFVIWFFLYRLRELVLTNLFQYFPDHERIIQNIEALFIKNPIDVSDPDRIIETEVLLNQLAFEDWGKLQ